MPQIYITAKCVECKEEKRVFSKTKICQPCLQAKRKTGESNPVKVIKTVPDTQKLSAELEKGLTSRSEVEDSNGRDFEEVMAQQKSEASMQNTLRLKINSGGHISSGDLQDLHIRLCLRGREIMAKKNADYKAGSGDPFANFRMSRLLHVEPAIGAMVRIQDKMARLVSFIERGDLAVKEESWQDAIIDIINYSVILHGLLDEKCQNQNGDKG